MVVVVMFVSVRVSDNLELLKQRVNAMTEKRDELSHDIRKQIERSHEHLGNINNLKPELKRLSKRRDQLKK